MIAPLAAMLLLAVDAPFDGPQYRYDAMPLPERFAYDLVAIPAGIPSWDERDWFELGLVAAPTAALMLTPAPSLDARIQGWVHQELGPDHFRLWTPLGDKLVW